jgi:predicted nucleotidyltransferase
VVDCCSLRRAGPGCDDGAVDDWVAVATGLLAGHPAVESVECAGSRSRGTHEELSDWDFAVEISDLDGLARDLPALVAPLDPPRRRVIDPVKHSWSAH